MPKNPELKSVLKNVSNLGAALGISLVSINPAANSETEASKAQPAPLVDQLSVGQDSLDLGALLSHLALSAPTSELESAPAPEPLPPPVTPTPKSPAELPSDPAPQDQTENLGEFEVTCYSLRGTTKSGQPAGPGAIAVDPRRIPLGTELYVPGYGSGTALDTRGAVKGNTLDVWMPSSDACIQWGRKVLEITKL